MNTKLMASATIILATITLAACQTGAGNTGGATDPGVCRPDAAEQLAGMSRVSDPQAMQMTGATLVRQIAPGQGVTMDYRQERVTIETDPRAGKIVRAACG